MVENKEERDGQGWIRRGREIMRGRIEKEGWIRRETDGQGYMRKVRVVEGLENGEKGQIGTG